MSPGVVRRSSRANGQIDNVDVRRGHKKQAAHSNDPNHFSTVQIVRQQKPDRDQSQWKGKQHRIETQRQIRYQRQIRVEFSIHRLKFWRNYEWRYSRYQRTQDSSGEVPALIRMVVSHELNVALTGARQSDTETARICTRVIFIRIDWAVRLHSRVRAETTLRLQRRRLAIAPRPTRFRPRAEGSLRTPP